MKPIVIKKVVPPANGDENKRKQVVKEGLDSVIKELKERGYLTCEEESIDEYTVLTFKVDTRVEHGLEPRELTTSAGKLNE